MELKPTKITTTIKHKETGEIYKTEEDWKAKGIEEKDIRRDVHVLMFYSRCNFCRLNDFHYTVTSFLMFKYVIPMVTESPELIVTFNNLLPSITNGKVSISVLALALSV